MALPWLRILDVALGLGDLARLRSTRLAPGRDAGTPDDRTPARLAGVVVAALKEAFDRDARRIEFEREQMEQERQRAERTLKLELARQAGDREIGRLRLLAGGAFASWLMTLLFSPRLVGGAVGPRIVLALGWLLLLGALALALTAQAAISRALARIDDASLRHDDILAGGGGMVVVWLIVAGLATVCLAILVA